MSNLTLNNKFKVWTLAFPTTKEQNFAKYGSQDMYKFS